MENINLYRAFKIETGLTEARQLIVDNITDTYLVLTNENLIHIFCKDHVKESFKFAGIIVSFEYLHQDNNICVAIEDGGIFFQNIEGAKNLEEVAFCEDGISTMQFSPDQEMVAFVTK